jgi:hypothetical protein
MKIMID